MARGRTHKSSRKRRGAQQSQLGSSYTLPEFGGGYTPESGFPGFVKVAEATRPGSKGLTAAQKRAQQQRAAQEAARKQQAATNARNKQTVSAAAQNLYNPQTIATILTNVMAPWVQRAQHYNDLAQSAYGSVMSNPDLAPGIRQAITASNNIQSGLTNNLQNAVNQTAQNLPKEQMLGYLNSTLNNKQAYFGMPGASPLSALTNSGTNQLPPNYNNPQTPNDVFDAIVSNLISNAAKPSGSPITGINFAQQPGYNPQSASQQYGNLPGF